MVPNIDYKIHNVHNGFIIEFLTEIKHLEEQICETLELINVGPFLGGGQLRFERKSEAVKLLILSALESMSIDELTVKHLQYEERLNIARVKRQEFLDLSPEQFLLEIQAASNQKLQPSHSSKRDTVALNVGELIPVTHFKKFARLGRWGRKTRCFEYTLPLTPLLRDKLYAAAKALGRSTKKVTFADIIARRARITEPQIYLDMDFSECMEDFGKEYALKMFEGRPTDSFDELFFSDSLMD